MKCDNDHLTIDFFTKSLLTSVSQDAASPRRQDINNRANHSDAVLFLSIHTHKHRANHSSVILLESTSERADLPKIVSKRIFDTSSHNKLSYKHVTEVSTDV